ncbi:hypothetical protein PLESTF_001954700, partial [Pleodorina starrii]
MTTCLYKECYPPTGVTLCEAAYFTHPPAHPPAAANAAATAPTAAAGHDAAAGAAAAAAASGSGSGCGGSGGGFSVQQPNLVLVRTNRLEVYRLRSSAAAAAAAAIMTDAATAAASGGGGGGGGGSGGSGGARLELVVSYHLHGVVESLAVLSGGTSRRRDALLLAFREGKLSVLEWDPRAHAVRTSSLHYFEGDPAAQREGRAAVPLPPRVVTDPAGRCAAMSLYCAQMALLPALEADSLDLGAAGGGGGGVATVGNGYLLNLNKMMGIREVRDCVFLHGYTEPVLLLLHEPDPTWVGRLRERKDTCCLTAISISLRLKRHTILWKMAGLPYDCYKLLAVPYRPAVLVISPNLLLLCSQASQHAAALNSNALPGEVPPPLVFDPAREPPATTAARLAAEYALNVHPDCAPVAGRNASLIADLEAVAAGASAAWLTPTTAIMGLQSGSLLAVHLQFEGPADQRINVVRTGGGPIASAMVGVTMAAAARVPPAAAGVAAAATAAAVTPYTSYRGPKGFMFLGSWSGDSVLMQLRPRKAAGAAGGGGEEDGGGGGGGGGAKDLKRGRGDGGGGGDDAASATNRSAAVAAAAAAFAAAAAAADAAGTAPRYNLRLLDSLPSFGPVRDLLVADTSVSSYTAGSGGGAEASRGGPTCFACVGQGQTGAIVMARQGLIADVLTEVGLSAVAGVFAVYHRTEDDDGAEAAAMEYDATAAADGGGDPGGADADGDDDGDGGRRAAIEMTPEPPEVEPAAAAAAGGGGGGGDGGGDGGSSTDVKMEEGADAKATGPEAGPTDEAEAGADVGGGGGGGGGGGEIKEEPAEPQPSGGAAAAATTADGAVAEGRAPPSPSPKRSPSKAEPPAAEPPAAAAAAAAPPPPSRPTGPPFHAYLLITLGRAKTMVLRCTDGLDDVTSSPECEFLVDQPTIAAGNLFHNAVIVQACPMGLRVLEGMSLVQDMPVTDFQMLGPLAAARQAGAAAPAITYMQTADPYVLVGLSNGTAVLLEGDPLSLTLGISTAAADQLMAAPGRGRQHRVAAAALHRDETGWMAAATATAAQPGGGAAADGSGGSSGGGDGGCSIFLWICRRSGRLECYSLPYMRLVFQSSGLAAGEEVLRMGPALMYDMYDLFGGGAGGGGGDGEADGGGAGGGGGGGVGMEDPVSELRVESFRGSSPSVPDCERPVVLALTASGTLLAYQAFDPSAGGSGQLGLRQALLSDGLAAAVAAAATHGSAAAAPSQRLALCRLPLDSLSHEAPALVAAAGGTAAGGTALGPRMVRFDHLAYTDPSSKSHGPSYSGVFLCGARPLWLVASRGGLLPHRMFVEGPVASMTPFHNANCPLGFISACPSSGSSSRGLLKVCQLQPHTRLDTPWVSRRVALRVTPHRLAWFRDAGLLAAITSRTVPSRPRPPEEPGGDPHASAAYAAAAASASGRGREEAWELRLLEPSGCGRLWSSALLPPGEQALCLRVVYLHNATTGDTDALLAVGTGCPMGEDYPCLGRILLYTISAEVVDLGGGNLTRRWSAVLVATRDMASAVTSVQEFKSQLLVSCGSRIEMYEWRGPPSGGSAGGAAAAGAGGGVLEKRAFFDLPTLVTWLVTVKDYLLAADATQGLYFVRYSDASRVLEFMSKDFDHRELLSAGVIINEPKLAFLAADAAGNLATSEFYGSRNTNPEFWAGQRLAPLGLMHVARRIGCSAPIKLPTGDGKNRHALLCGVAEGGLSYVAPVPDSETAQRLQALQNHMSRALPHVAGLNPRAFRHRFCRIPKALGGGEAHHSAPPPRSNGLLDGQLLCGFPLLSSPQHRSAAEAVGATVAQLMADLR